MGLAHRPREEEGRSNQVLCGLSEPEQRDDSGRLPIDIHQEQPGGAEGSQGILRVRCGLGIPSYLCRPRLQRFHSICQPLRKFPVQEDAFRTKERREREQSYGRLYVAAAASRVLSVLPRRCSHLLRGCRQPRRSSRESDPTPPASRIEAATQQDHPVPRGGGVSRSPRQQGRGGYAAGVRGQDPGVAPAHDRQRDGYVAGFLRLLPCLHPGVHQPHGQDERAEEGEADHMGRGPRGQVQAIKSRVQCRTSTSIPGFQERWSVHLDHRLVQHRGRRHPLPAAGGHRPVHRRLWTEVWQA